MKSQPAINETRRQPCRSSPISLCALLQTSTSDRLQKPLPPADRAMVPRKRPRITRAVSRLVPASSRGAHTMNSEGYGGPDG